MALDRHVAEQRRFARLLGTDAESGFGLPIGPSNSEDEDEDGTSGNDGRRRRSERRRD